MDDDMANAADAADAASLNNTLSSFLGKRLDKIYKSELSKMRCIL